MILTVFSMALLSYLLKALPLSFSESMSGRLEWVTKWVDYSVCFIIGMIIVNVALGGVTVSDIISKPSVTQLNAVLTLLIAYLVSNRTRSILKSLAVSLVFFGVVTAVVL